MTKEYIYCYEPLIRLMRELSSSDMRLLYCMAFMSDDKDMRLETTIYNLVQKSGVGLKFVNKGIDKLVLLGVIKRVSDKVFYINPEYIWNSGVNGRTRAYNRYMK